MAEAFKHFSFQDEAGIAVIKFDLAGREQNLINAEVFASLTAICDKIANDDNIKGAVLTSAKKDFCFGADVSMLSSGSSTSSGSENPAAVLYQNILNSSMCLRKLETCNKPIVAAINGSALGGGLELTLACHYRIAADNPKTRLGLPEARLGLLPGAGGTQRLPRLISAAAALPLLLQGTALNVEAAKQAGFIHEIVPADQLIAKAKDWVLQNPEAKQPWDQKKFRVPGGAPYDRGTTGLFVVGNAQLRKNSFGNYPAQQYIMSCVYEGLLVPIEAGLRIEARYFTKILLDPRAKAMMRSLFLSTQALKKGARRPQGIEKSSVKKLGVLGAGLMGSGIAYTAAKAGIEVVLLDRAQADADKGMARIEKTLAQQKSKRRLSEQAVSEILSRISAGDDYAKLKGADLIVEAVFEDRKLKAKVTKKAEAHLSAHGVMASNTSTLPITGLAEASKQPKRFIGLHFFSPVERMQLVEIICGKQTAPETLAHAMDFVAQIGKTPIVVNDSRGFYTSRCFGTYVREGIAMLAEGVAPAIIENGGLMSGMPMPPLALADAVGLDLAHAVREQTKKDLGDQHKASESEEANDAIIAALVERFARLGKKSGKGFYDYHENGAKRLWPGLSDLVERAQPVEDVDIEEIKNRLLYIQALEAVRCLEAKVITDIRDGDVGAILGWGFAPWSGGPLSLIDVVGSEKFSGQCQALAQKYGARFNPPALLLDLAKHNEAFYTRFAPAA